MRAAPPELARLVATELRGPVAPHLAPLVETLRTRHGPGVRAILFYGSCFRGTASMEGGLLDLCVLVDDYKEAYSSRTLALANRILPPNVFHLKAGPETGGLRAKVAVVSMEQFRRRVGTRCFEAYFWARFAQRCGLAYARDEATVETIVGCLSSAVCTFLGRALPLVGPDFTALDLWERGLLETYRTELRPERPGTAHRLANASPEHYRSLTEAALPALPFAVRTAPGPEGRRFVAVVPEPRRWLSRAAWRGRRLQGKCLQVLRLAKAAFTFEGGPEYIAWKIARHAGPGARWLLRRRGPQPERTPS